MDEEKAYECIYFVVFLGFIFPSVCEVLVGYRRTNEREVVASIRNEERAASAFPAVLSDGRNSAQLDQVVQVEPQLLAPLACVAEDDSRHAMVFRDCIGQGLPNVLIGCCRAKERLMDKISVVAASFLGEMEKPAHGEGYNCFLRESVYILCIACRVLPAPCSATLNYNLVR